MSRRKKKINLLPFFRNRRPAQIVFIIFFLLPVLLVSILLIFLPVYEQMKEQSLEIKSGDQKKSGLLASSEKLAAQMSSLQVEEAYLKSLYALRRKDSIMLSIDLHDSLLSILIKGIPARQCTIKEYRMSHAIPHIAARDTMHSWLYPPFKLQKEWATIPKAPIRIMDAPKDTIEANAMAGEEISIEKNDVHFTMQFNRGLTVVVEQLQTPSWKGRWKKFIYDLERLHSQALKTIKELKQKQLPQHQLWIEVYISREDAKAVYRATPHSLEMALRL
ncbi:hypothetical protein JXO59_00910 [candidate division KSB1 bacterium]|nr:hypothetical protein [candidate division KSB1 bacterium]